jgi:hypothetical protein
MSLEESTHNIALRRTGEYCNGYVFTAKPVVPGETVVVQVLFCNRSKLLTTNRFDFCAELNEYIGFPRSCMLMWPIPAQWGSD